MNVYAPQNLHAELLPPTVIKGQGFWEVIAHEDGVHVIRISVLLKEV